MAKLTGIETRLALLCTAHIFLIGSFVLLAAYLCVHPNADTSAHGHVLVLFGLWPTTFFFRMNYSESTFIFLMLLTLYAMVRRWPLVVIGLLAGAATGARPVGVALLLPLAYTAWRDSAGARAFLLRMGWLAPLACWGLLAFMAYQYIRFDEPFAFAKTQTYWRLRPVVGAQEKIIGLLTLEPLWSVYCPTSPAYWRNVPTFLELIFSIQVANPIYFSVAALLVAVGAWRRWLTAPEVLLAAGLLLIPYCTRGYEMAMASHGRFAAVVFPAYIVAGRVLSRLPASVSGGLYAICALFLTVYAALFAAGYLVI